MRNKKQEDSQLQQFLEIIRQFFNEPKAFESDDCLLISAGEIIVLMQKAYDMGHKKGQEDKE